jgi:hypothetical protein
MKFYCEYYDKLNNFIDINEIVQISKEIFGNNTDEYLMNIYIGKYMREYYEDKWYNELFILIIQLIMKS